MDLLEYKNYTVNISPQAFLVRPIREIYEADTSKNKESFYSQMSYMFFMCDPRSNYNYITDLSEREKVIKEQEGLPAKFKPSKKLLEAMEWYRKLTITTSVLLLEDTRKSIDKVRKFLTDIDLEETDDKGRPKYTINSFTSTIKLVPQLARDLIETERIIVKEQNEVTRARGGDENKTVFEDGFNLF